MRSFIFFGSSSGDDYWGINVHHPNQIITFHHHMQNHYELIGADILEVYREDYALYDNLE